MGDRLYVYMIHDQPIPSIRGHEGNKPRVDFRFKQKNAISDLLTVQRFDFLNRNMAISLFSHQIYMASLGFLAFPRPSPTDNSCPPRKFADSCSKAISSP